MGYSVKYARKILRVLAAALVISALCCGSALAAPLAVYLDGHEIPSDVVPIARSGRTLAPLRTVSSALGAIVDYRNGEAIIQTAASEVLRFKPGEPSFVFEKAGVRETRALDVPAAMSEGRIFVPLRVIAETFNVKTDFQDGNVLLSSTPQYVDDQPLTTLAMYQKMTMGGYWLAYYGNADIGIVYQLVQELKQQEIPAPVENAAELAAASWIYVGDNYYLNAEFRFYSGKALINEQGQAEPGVANYLIYSWVGKPGEGSDAIYDMEQDKWYTVNEDAQKKLWEKKNDMNLPAEGLYSDYV